MSKFECDRNTLVSSANIIEDESIKQLGKSLIYKIHKSGPSCIQPIGNAVDKARREKKIRYLLEFVAFYHYDNYNKSTQ